MWHDFWEMLLGRIQIPFWLYHSCLMQWNLWLCWQGHSLIFLQASPGVAAGHFRSSAVVFPRESWGLKEVQHINSSSEPQSHGTPHIKWKKKWRKRKGCRQKLSQKSNWIERTQNKQKEPNEGFQVKLIEAQGKTSLYRSSALPVLV